MPLTLQLLLAHCPLASHGAPEAPRQTVSSKVQLYGLRQFGVPASEPEAMHVAAQLPPEQMLLWHWLFTRHDVPAAPRQTLFVHE